MFPYKGFFQRHPLVGGCLIASSVGGIFFLSKYLAWLENKERAYNDMLRDCNIAQFFSVFMEEYKMIGYWDEYAWKHMKCKRDGKCLYIFINPDELGLASKSGYMIDFFQTNVAIGEFSYHDLKKNLVGIREDFNEHRYTTLLKRFFGMNDAQAKIMWDRTYPYAIAEGRKNEEDNRGCQMAYKAGTQPMLTPVRYIQCGIHLHKHCPETEHTLGV